MRKAPLVGIMLVLACSPIATGATDDDFHEVVDFEVTLKTLSVALEANDFSAIDAEKIVIVHGTVSTMSFLDTKRQSYTVLLELVAGEWLDLDEVKSYRCLVVFQGPAFYTLIPRRPPRGSTAAVIGEASRVLVIARVLEPVTTELGENMWLLAGIDIRSLD